MNPILSNAQDALNIKHIVDVSSVEPDAPDPERTRQLMHVPALCGYVSEVGWWYVWRDVDGESRIRIPAETCQTCLDAQYAILSAMPSKEVTIPGSDAAMYTTPMFDPESTP